VGADFERKQRVKGREHVDFSRTKTIFIVTFFILNLFLGYQLYQKQSNNQFEYIAESSVKIEDQLKNAGITYPELPEVPKQLSHVIGETYTFSQEEISQIESDELEVTVSEDYKKLFANFHEPKAFIGSGEEAKSIVASHGLFADEYVYSKTLSKKGKELVFIQTYEGRPVFQKEDSENGQVVVKIEDGNVAGFSQTYLKMSEEGKEQEILTDIKAINQLYNKNKLEKQDKITAIELGYYSLIEGKVQVLAPTWFIEVNNERHYYVNAINGLIDDPNVNSNIQIEEGVQEQ